MNTVAVIGIGTMGKGIAQIAAAHGWTVFLVDQDPEIASGAIIGLTVRYERLVEKGKMTEAEKDAALARLHTDVDWAQCDLVIEAIVEDLAVKTRVLADVLPKLPADAIIATNTSSLSVTELGAALGAAERTVGMHFFNPAPLLKLVEVIAGAETAPAVVDRVVEIATAWGKVVARAADVPGFIVNHVARPYYLEAFRLLEDGIADVKQIDDTMVALGFRMGPLALTDLIGQDVNTATTRSVWNQLGHPPLLAPNQLQEALVERRWLGKKSKRGIYDYTPETPAPALSIDVRRPRLDADGERDVRAFADAAARAVDGTAPTDTVGALIVTRILGGLIVQARRAAERGVARAEDIDTALRYGVNYPMGPFAWADAIGADVTRAGLAAAGRTADDDRFADVAASGTMPTL